MLSNHNALCTPYLAIMGDIIDDYSDAMFIRRYGTQLDKNDLEVLLMHITGTHTVNNLIR